MNHSVTYYFALWAQHLIETKTPLSIGFFGSEKTSSAQLLQLKTFEYTVKIGENEEEHKKISMKYMFKEDSNLNFPVKAQLLEQQPRPAQKPKDRYQIPFQSALKGNQVCLTLLEGEEITGHVILHGKFDILLALSPNTWIWVFKHAVADSRMVAPRPKIPPPFHIKNTKIQEILEQDDALSVEYISLLIDLALSKSKTSSEKAQEKLPLSSVAAELFLILKKATEQSAAPEVSKQEKSPKSKKKVDPELLFKELDKETERTMVNAKLKIVLRELPETKEVEGMIHIPLLNQAKSVPGAFELPDIPIDLLATKKMWKNAQKKADELLKSTEIPPIQVVEALIGLRENKLVAVASGIQVMPGKSKEKKEKKEQSEEK